MHNIGLDFWHNSNVSTFIKFYKDGIDSLVYLHHFDFTIERMNFFLFYWNDFILWFSRCLFNWKIKVLYFEKVDELNWFRCHRITFLTYNIRLQRDEKIRYFYIFKFRYTFIYKVNKNALFNPIIYPLWQCMLLYNNV